MSFFLVAVTTAAQTVALLQVVRCEREGSFHPSFLSLGDSGMFDLLLLSVSRRHALHSV